MKYKLPPSVYSADQLIVCSEELHAWAVAQGRAKKPDKDWDMSNESAELLQLMVAAKRNDPEAIEQLRTDLEKLIQTNPTATVTLAAPAPHALKIDVVSWLRQNLDVGLLVNFHVNPDIAGGMVIRLGSKMIDLSFRRNLLENAGKFVEVLDRV